MNEEEYKAELKANGVEMPELETAKPEVKTDLDTDPDKPEKPADRQEEPEGDEKEPDGKKPDEHLLNQEPEKPKKRSIYDDLKDKKSELKTERQMREDAERQRDELQAKLDAASDAKPGESADTAEEDAIKYAEKIGADPDLVKRIIADARKSIPTLDDQTKQDLAEFKDWKKSSAKDAEKQAFNEEFTKQVPTLKEYFPSVSAAELETIKEKLDTISHSKDWHDKSLDYIIFKHKDALSADVSPKKRGMESRERKDISTDSYEFNPNADLSTMNGPERDRWETEYRKAGQADGLMTGSDGKKLII